jgi:hypothetical protein
VIIVFVQRIFFNHPTQIGTSLRNRVERSEDPPQRDPHKDPHQRDPHMDPPPWDPHKALPRKDPRVLFGKNLSKTNFSLLD